MLKMTQSMIDKKVDKFKKSDTTVPIVISIVAWVLANFFIYHIIENFLYYLDYGCKLFNKTGSIVDKKTNEFTIPRLIVPMAVIIFAFVLSSCCSVLLFVICLK